MKKRAKSPNATMKTAILVCIYEFRNTLQDLRLIMIVSHKKVTRCPTFKPFKIYVFLILAIDSLITEFLQNINNDKIIIQRYNMLLFTDQSPVKQENEDFLVWVSSFDQIQINEILSLCSSKYHRKD